MELDPARGELLELLENVRHAWIVEQFLARLPRRRVHRDVERREAILEDARDVALLHVRERREVSIRERETVVVVADVQRTAQSLRQALDETELAAVRATADRGRLEFEPHRLVFGTFDVVDHALAVGERGLDLERVLGGEKLPIEEIFERAPVHREQLGTGENPQFFSDASGVDAGDLYH